MAELSLKELKDLADDNEIDLSARGLTSFPKGLLQLKKITKIDLSKNKLTSLPEELCGNTRIVRLELGGNQIVSLPNSIGDLVNLQHLDLFNNEIEELPLSFSNLSSLKWLDLKKNPLELGLLKAAGNCGNEKECKQAAVNVVKYMTKLKDDQERIVAHQEIVNQKIQTGKAEQKKTDNKKKKKSSPNESHGIHEKPKHAPNSQQNRPPPKSSSPSPKVMKASNSGFVIRVIRWVFFLAVCLFGAATVSILLNCANGGKNFAGAKALCNDLTRISGMQRPSDKFVKNVRNTYSVVFRRYRMNVEPFVADVASTTKYYYGQAAKSDFGKRVEKFLYDAHAFVVEKSLVIRRFFVQKYADFEAWYSRDGQKMFGGFVDNCKIAGSVAYEVVKDVALVLYDASLVVYHRVEDFVITAKDKGFSKALEKIL